MIGRVVKLLPRMYFVQVEDKMYKCKSKGKMRLAKEKALVGDLVEIEVDPIEDDAALIKRVINRRNSLKRPEIANIDNLIISFAMDKPAPNLELLDRLLIQAEKRGVHSVICFNKTDLDEDKAIDEIKQIYSKTTYPFIFISAESKSEETKECIFSLLNEGVNVFAGPSGVGKSTMINLLKPEAEMETGEISEKLKRGKHTTRHSELIHLGKGIFLCDTPGFTSYDSENVEPIHLQKYMPEIWERAPYCKFRDCMHLNEPECMVIEAVKEGMIAENRYKSYKLVLQEAINTYKNRY